jgi:hypothetical protein
VVSRCATRGTCIPNMLPGRPIRGGSVLNGQVQGAEEALALHFRMIIQFLGSHTITLPVIQTSSTQKPEMPWKTWQPTPETNPARALSRLCPSVTTMSKPCCPVKKTANAQFDTSVQLLQSQPPMQMSDYLKSTQQQPTVPPIRQWPECRKQNVSLLLTR